MYTDAEKLLLLEGELDAANAVIKMFKIALDANIIERKDVQHDLTDAIESWLAMCEQRVCAETKDDPSHIFN